jgi:hypothetical protein
VNRNRLLLPFLLTLGTASLASSVYGQGGMEAPTVTNPATSDLPFSIRLGRELLRISGLNDDPQREFDVGSERILATVAPDGGIVVSDRTRILSFAPTGEWRWTFGRAGGGPGEFRGIGSLCITSSGDILASDPGIRRVTAISPTGRLLRTTILPGSAVRGCLADGSVIASAQTVQVLPDRRRRVEFQRVTPDGGVRRLGDWPPTNTVPTRRPGPVGAGNAVIVADEFAARLTYYSLSGAVLRVVTFADTPIPLSAASYDSAYALMFLPGTSRAVVRQTIARARQVREVPTELPLIAGVLAGGVGGWIWIHGQVTRDDWRNLTLVDPAGRARGRLRLEPPAGAIHWTLAAIDHTRAAFVMTDADGIRHVVVREIVHPR